MKGFHCLSRETHSLYSRCRCWRLLFGQWTCSRITVQ